MTDTPKSRDELEAERDKWRSLTGQEFHEEHGLRKQLLLLEAERDRLLAVVEAARKSPYPDVTLAKALADLEKPK